MEKLANDAQFYMERTSPSCDNKVPHEGIVIKIENMRHLSLNVSASLILKEKLLTLGK